MFKRYRALAAGLALTAVVVLLCLWLPGIFLRAEGQMAVGMARQADRLYYADNISTGNVVDFDLNIRLLMHSGQWKSRREAIAPDEVFQGDQVLSKPDMRRYGAALFSFLAEDVWTCDFCVRNMAYFSDDSARSYISMLLQGEDYAQVLRLSAMEDAVLTLYRYEDQILNSYYFYMWEYVFRNEAMGVDVVIEADAVTLEVYRVSVHGGLFDELPWREALDLMISDTYEDLNIYGAFYGAYPEAVLPATAVTVIPAFLSSCWMGMQGVDQGFGASAPFLFTQPGLATGENGYAFYTGNFWFANIPVQCNVYADPDWLAIEGVGGETVYGNVSWENGGLEWSMAAELEE